MSKPAYSELETNQPRQEKSGWVPKLVGAVLVVGLAWLIFGKGSSLYVDQDPENDPESFDNDTLIQPPNPNAEEDDTQFSTDFSIANTYDRLDPQYYT